MTRKNDTFTLPLKGGRSLHSDPCGKAEMKTWNQVILVNLALTAVGLWVWLDPWPAPGETALPDLVGATDSLGQVTRPVVHQDTPALEQVRAGIGRLDLVPDHMRQGRLDHLPGMIGLLGCPIAEAGAEPVRHGRNPKLAQQPPQLLVIERLPLPTGEHQWTGSRLKCLRRLENLQGRSAQRHPMLAVGLHPPGRDGPYTRLPVDLLPLGPPHLAPPGCRQHQELEGQLRCRQCRRSPHRPDSRSHLPMRQGPHVPDNVLLGAKDRADPVAGVVDPVLHGHGPFQDRTQAQADPPGRLRLPVPDGREDLKHVGTGNLRDRHLADAREGQPPQARQPLAGVFPVAPAGLLLFQHTRGSFGEGGDTLGAALLKERVSALAGELAVDEGLLSGLGQGDQGEAAESELTAAATDDEALNPAAGSARLDEEVEAIAVSVSSGRGGAEERDRKGLLGMAAGGLTSWLAVGWRCLQHPFPHYMGDGSGLQEMMSSGSSHSETQR